MKPVTDVSLSRALENSWSAKSSTLWTEDKPASGQCDVTALVVQDMLGGEILKTRHGEIWHFYNRVDGNRVDLTDSQFDGPIAYDDRLTNRDEAFLNTSSEQYNHLSQAVQKDLHGD